MKETVYISFSENTELNKTQVKLADIASVWCSDSSLLAKLKTMTVLDVPEVKSRRYVFSAMKIIKMIVEKYPQAEINNIGAAEFVVRYNRDVRKGGFVEKLKIILICIIIFCGGAFAIMAYGNDIQLNELMEFIAGLFGKDDKTLLITMQAAYSIGLTAGIIIFYNHIGKRRYAKDPTPLEVEMRLYETDMNNALIDDSVREGKIEDVD